MHSFYAPNVDFSSKSILLNDPSEVHHLKNVLRLKIDAEVLVFNRKGEQAQAKVKGIHPKSIELYLITVKSIPPKTPRIILACAMPKKSKFETIIEKATELGADEIIALKTKRTEIELKGDRLDKKTERYQTIAINAAKQSQRFNVPHVLVMDFASVLDYLLKESIVIMPSLSKNTKSLYPALTQLQKPKQIAILIGPEGDFTPEEYHQAHSRGCIPVSLGPTVLKVETAALSALASINTFYFS